MARALIGISGWSYRSWRGDFYPEGLRQRDELSYAAERMGSVELNGSFYSLQRPSSYDAWRDATPDDFVLAVKGGRYLTHMKRLRDTDTALANFLASGVLRLGAKLGPLLWQLPESVRFDTERVGGFLASLPRSTGAAAEVAARHDDKVPEPALEALDDRPLRHALEPRHPSFATAEAVALLREHGVALVHADSAGRWPAFDEDTADFRYVRLHGHTELYASGYDAGRLDAWAERCRGWLAAGQDVHVYFDNDARGHAPHDAVALHRRLTDIHSDA
ncbi:DUF72 domain-containing protein [Nocardioides sp. SYSU D00038]|uniref:DUF72 domain-containing protein n=1 Tax=Nocardioides sp. SYSU D00038 TaxID=2812554 RepID=UPI001967E599|nr:DUF72 domain-containing protein [Nocardioides sp. SYSU D00038]